MKKIISVLLVFCMLCPMFGIQVSAADNVTLFLSAQTFADNLGSWQILDETAKGGVIPVLVGTADSSPEDTTCAAVAINLPQDGKYKVWALTRDFTSSPDGRFCNIQVGETYLEKKVGLSGSDAWQWMEIGSVDLKKGETFVRIHDTGAYWARVEGIILTTDSSLKPSADSQSIIDMSSKYEPEILNVNIPEVDINGNPMKPAVELKEDKTYIVLTPTSFEGDYGSWVPTPNDAGGYVINYLKGGSGYAESDDYGNIDIKLPKDGYYRALALTREYTTYVGERFFDIQLGNLNRQRLGVHGKDGWAWDSTQEFPVYSGEYDLKLIDSSGNYTRMAMLIITDDSDLELNGTAAEYNFLMKNIYEDGMYKVPEKSTKPDVDRPNTEIAVKLNGEYLNFDVPPVLINDRTMVPFRAIFEALECSVSWNDETQTAKGTRNYKTISLPIGSKAALVNGKSVPLDQPAELINDRTLVPLRFVSESLGAAVDWNDATQTVSIMAKIPEEVYWFTADSFGEVGTWTYIDEGGSLTGKILRGTSPVTDNPVPTLADADPSGNKPAVTTFNVRETGDYYVWARSRDFESNQPGTRTFHIAINGKQLDKKFGTHGKNGYAWERVPSKVTLNEGENTLEVRDTSGFWARFDSVLICKSEDFVPAENYSELLSLASPVPMTDNEFQDFPLYANELNVPTESATIENELTKAVFYKVPTLNGQVIQNEIYSKHNGTWVKTKNRDEDLGFFVNYANEAKYDLNSARAQYTTSYTSEGKEIKYQGFDPFLAGNGKWFVPIDYSIDGNTVKLVFNETDNMTLDASWTLENGNAAPLVTASVTAKNDGYYTIGAWEGGEFYESEYTDAVAPYIVIKKKVPEEVCAIIEQYLFTPMGCYTLKENNQYSSEPVTKGVVIDPEWIPRHWAHEQDSAFAIAMKSPDSNYKGTVFAPILGSDESKLEKNGTYTLKYRVISAVSDWFDNYKFVTQYLYNVHDYRQNTYSTLNDAIFNTRKLMLDDFYGGWDKYSKGYYNIEAMNTVSESNPMQAVQDYLLTEDDEILERRTIPTIAALLTRPSLHFNRTDKAYGVLSGWGTTTSKDYDAIGTPRFGFNINVIGGIYEMTRGNTPYLYKLGLEKGVSGVENAYGNIAPFSNNLNMYIYTGDKSYLDKAIKQADEYIEKEVYGVMDRVLLYEEQTYTSQYPNFASLLDIYEVTKDKKYLDAAEYVAELVLTGLWTVGVQNDRGSEEITVNNYDTFFHRAADGKDFNSLASWHGDKLFRLGYDNSTGKDVVTAKLEEETVQRWVPERVGLGMEATSTFENGSCNVVMQYFAGDFMRLAQYTGEKAFSDAAKNAIVGRFSNYSGYYITDYLTANMKADFPYKGPDITGIYYHHLPPFLAMLEDFLFGQTQNLSNGNITFPSLRQQGYAYFNSRQFGHKAGKFYDQTDMWPYLAENTIDSGNLQIDWLAARKDKMLGIAFMNESEETVTTTVSLLEALPGDSEKYSGPATIYTADGKKSDTTVENGKFEITVPAKGLTAITIAIPDMKAPSFAKSDYTLDNNYEIGATVSEHTNGKGYAIQISPDNYFAYVYVTDTPASGAKSAELTYSVNGKTETVTCDTYPYEFIVRIDDTNAEFTYGISLTTDKGKKNMGTGRLMTVALSKKKGIKDNSSKPVVGEQTSDVEYKGSGKQFEPIKLDYSRQGQGNGAFRFIVPQTSIKGVDVTEKELVGLTVTGNVIKSGIKTPITSTISAIELRDSDVVICVPETSDVTTAVYYSSDTGKYTFDLMIMPYTK